MIFDKLHIKHFKGIDDLSIENLGSINFIVGKNNGGKSTVLDALYLVAKKGDPRSIEDIYAVRSALINKGDDLRFLFPKSDLTVYPTIEGFTAKANLFICLQAYNGDIKDGNIIKESGVDLPIDGVRLVSDKLFESKNYAPKPDMYSLMVKRKSEDTIDYRFAKDIQSIPILYVPTGATFNKVLSLAKEAIVSQSFQLKVLGLLKEIEPRIMDYHILDGDIYFMLEGLNKSINLKSMGEGFVKLFGIILAIIHCENGICLIDEIENGLHHSVLKGVWKHILKASETHHVQLFITTHNAEILEAITKVSEPKQQKEINVIRLVKEEGKGHIALNYDFDSLVRMIENGNEIRGW